MLASTATPGQTLIVIVLGMLLGVVGQFIRLVAEIADPQRKLNGKALAINIATAVVIGTAAGAVGAVTFIGKTLQEKDVLTMIAAGYVGTDFITQFLRKKFASLQTNIPPVVGA